MRTRRKLLLSSLVISFAVTSIATMLYPFSDNGSRAKEGYLFTFAHITDSQFSESSAILEKVTSWLAQQDNMSFVVHTGDVVNGPFDEAAWKNAHNYMHQLDKRGTWGVLAGDNDVLQRNRIDLTNYRKYLGNNSVDQYFVVGDKLLFILFSWADLDGGVSHERLEWMDEVIQEHEELYVAVCLHPYLFGYPFLNYMRVSNADEIWSHIQKHKNVIMTLSGHIHQNWINIHINGKNKVWSLSTEALIGRGYVRLFDVYKDRVEAYAYSPWTNETYRGTLDRFTIELDTDNYDVDADLWRDDLDIMPTHPFVPNAVLIFTAIAITLLICWAKGRKSKIAIV